MKTLFGLLCAAPLADAAHVQQADSIGRQMLESSRARGRGPFLPGSQVHEHFDHKQVVCVPLDQPLGEAGMGYVVQNHGFTNAEEDLIISGKMYGKLKNAEKKEGKFLLDAARASKGRLEERDGVGRPGRGLRAHQDFRLFGNRRVLVVRIKTTTTDVRSSAAFLSDKWFGTSGDQWNLKTGYDACSNGQLNMIPAVGDDVTNGVIEVQLGISADNTDDTLRAAAKTELSNMGVDYLAIADHVVMCIPDGSQMSGIAYAFIHSWESVYNDDWCNYPSSQMHEIGHNLGLAHSNEKGNEYNDESGMMGFSFSQDEGPVQCFNGAKMWNINWFPEWHEDLTAGGSFNSRTYDLVGVSDIMDGYAVAGSDKLVVALLGNWVETFIYFNRQEGVNSGTLEAANQVTVTQHPVSSNEYAESELLAKLSSGRSYSISNFEDSGQSLTITVNSLSTTSGSLRNVASVTISGPFTPPPTPPPTDGPDFPQCSESDLSKTRSSDCGGERRKNCAKRIQCDGNICTPCVEINRKCFRGDECMAATAPPTAPAPTTATPTVVPTPMPTPFTLAPTPVVPTPMPTPFTLAPTSNPPSPSDCFACGKNSVGLPCCGGGTCDQQGRGKKATYSCIN